MKSMQVFTASTGVRKAPKADASLETELLFGEVFEVESAKDGWAYGTARIDGYPGYVQEADLTGRILKPTHRISAAHTLGYRESSFKGARKAALHMNSLLTVLDGPYHRVETPEGVMVRERHMGWFFEDHLRPVEEFAPDFVAEALKFVGTGYEWGARSEFLDCSALVQTALMAAGIVVPRDCIPQSREIGRALVLDSPVFVDRIRGDLVFWTEKKGRHVAIMIDETRCVHATIAAPSRGVAVESLWTVIADQERDGNGAPTTVRRLL